jgi:type II secretory pathway pseudopilin PulG
MPKLAKAAHVSRGEGGFTLPELLIATFIAMIVLGAAVTVFTAGIRSQPRVTAQSTAIEQARTAMERMIRELRQGSSVPSASASQLAIVTYVRDSTCGTSTPLCRVTYTCSADACTRTVARPDGTLAGTPVRVVSGLSPGTNVFAYTPAASGVAASVTVTMSMTGEAGSNAITLSDQAALRNPSGS